MTRHINTYFQVSMHTPTQHHVVKESSIPMMVDAIMKVNKRMAQGIGRPAMLAERMETVLVEPEAMTKIGRGKQWNGVQYCSTNSGVKRSMWHDMLKVRNTTKEESGQTCAVCTIACAKVTMASTCVGCIMSTNSCKGGRIWQAACNGSPTNAVPLRLLLTPCTTHSH